MTSSVPYSFVPGAKAKAEEVNANFIAVLDEIEKSNVKIEDLNTQKLNKDLSNIDAEGQKVLDTKADKTELDGKWTVKSGYIANDLTISTTFDKTFDISSLLPDDKNIYEVVISAIIRTGININNSLGLYVNTAICGSTYLCRTVTRTAGANQIASGNCTIPIAADRKIRFFAGDETNSASYKNGCAFRISGYRKVR